IPGQNDENGDRVVPKTQRTLEISRKPVEWSLCIEEAEARMKKYYIERGNRPEPIQIFEPERLFSSHFACDPSGWSLDASRVPEYMDNVCLVSEGAVAWSKASEFESQ